MTEMSNDTAEIPLCVDLDDTLVLTDTLSESVGKLIKENIFYLPMLPVWLLQGRAHLKEMVASRVKLDLEYLPFNEKVLQLIKEAKKAGRKTVLCTGANYRHAVEIAEHLGLFDEVIGSAEAENMTREAKQLELVTRFGEGGYDYVGDDIKDLPVMQSAREAILVRPTKKLQKASKTLSSSRVLEPRAKVPLTLYLQQIRLHQWLKNLLLFLPLFAAHEVLNADLLLACGIGFVSFGFCASSIYVLNDLMDIQADRRHPRKRNRPFASARIPAFQGYLMMPALLLAAVMLSLLLPIQFLGVLVLYYVVSLTYNLWAKNVAVIDTIFLAGLYTVRIIAGAAATLIVPSFWLLAFAMFLFLSIALAKRYTEIIDLELDENEVVPGRQYMPVDLSTLMSQGAASGYGAVVVLALYVNSEEVALNYSRPELIWLACPILLYWINKLWLNTQRREMTDDPLIWAISNRVSRGLGLALLLILLFAT